MDNTHLWNLIAKKLSGEASSGELKELETILRSDPELHYALEALHDMWQKKTAIPAEQAEAAFQKHLAKMHSRGIDMGKTESASAVELLPDEKPPFTTWKILSFIVSAIVLLVLSYKYILYRDPEIAKPKPLWEVVTHNGTRTNIILPDGSSVWLNAGSNLSYDSLYGTRLREVSLSGEAYFDVVRNPQKPFIIHTGKMNIKVLGTIFNVKSYPEEKTIETSLIKGSIEVSFPSLPSKKIILRPNQKLVVDKTEAVAEYIPAQNSSENKKSFFSIQHLNRAGPDSSIVETGWMKNRLYFNDMAFRELLKNMERKYGVTFRLNDTSLSTAHFTGSFQDESVSEALDALRFSADKTTTDFTYDLEDNQIIIYNNSGEHPIQQK